MCTSLPPPFLSSSSWVIDLYLGLCNHCIVYPWELGIVSLEHGRPCIFLFFLYDTYCLFLFGCLCLYLNSLD
jgi:hypothetical protein